MRRLWTFLSEQLDAPLAAGVQEPAAGDRQLILGVLKAGLDKNPVKKKKKKNSPVGIFGFFGVFVVFFINIFDQLLIECRFYFFLKYS